MTEERQERARTGIAGLDDVLQGGLPRDHIYLVVGPSGSGKTTLALQFLLEGARRGERTLYIGTSETEEELREIARSHGWDLSGVELRHHGGPVEQEPGPEQTMLHPVEVELPRVMDQLMHTVEEVKPERMAIDSLTEIRLLSREDSWFRDQIKILQERLTGKRCTALLTDLREGEQPVVRSVVHGVIELDHATAAFGPDRRRIRVAKMRGMAYRSGYHDLSIGRGGLRVFPRLVAAEHRGRFEAETLGTGLPELDRLLGGGVDRGTSTLLLGPTGTGKSTLATQLAVEAARRGDKSAMYLFDERAQTLYQRAAGLGLELAEQVEAGLVTVQQVDPAELTPGELTWAVMEAVDDGARTVVIDSLNGYAHAMPEERLLSLHLHELLSFLGQRAVTSLHVMTQHGVLGPDVDPPFDVSYIADTVILLRPFEVGGAVRKAISVVKRRAGPHEKTIRELDLSQGRVIIGEPLEQFSGVISGNPRFLRAELGRPGEAR